MRTSVKVVSVVGVAALVLVWGGLILYMLLAPKAVRRLPRVTSQAVWAVHAAAADADAPAVRETLDALVNALERSDGEAFADTWDNPRFVEEMESHGLRGRMQAAAVRETVENVRRAKIGEIGSWRELYSPRVEILRLRHTGPLEVVACARHLTDTGGARRIEWRLRRTGRVWRVYDMENIDYGLRNSLLTAVYSAADDVLHPRQARYIALRDAIDAAQNGDDAAAEALLGRIPWAEMPAAARFVVARLRLSTALALGPKSAVPAAVQACEAAGWDSSFVHWARSQSANARDANDEALGHMARFQAEFGPDPLAAAEAGAIMELLERPAEGIAHYRAGLDLDPDSWECLRALARLLGQGEKGEIARLMERTRCPMHTYVQAARTFAFRDDVEALEAANAGARKRLPREPIVPVFEAHALLLRGKFDEALGLVRSLEIDEREMRGLYSAYVAQARKSESPEVIYDRAPQADRAFGALAWQLLAEDPAALERLIERHGKRSPRDHNRYLLLANLRNRQKRHVEAEAACVEGLRLTTDPDQSAWLRRVRVTARYGTGDALGAYRDIFPQHDTFQQLVPLLAEEKRADELAALIAAHAKHHPMDAELALAHARLAMARNDPRGCLAILDAHAALLKPGHGWVANHLRMRAFLRAADARAAMAEAVRQAGGAKVTWDLMLAHALAGNASETIAQIEGILRDECTVAELYEDEDFVRLTAKPGMARVRETYPPPAPATVPATAPTR